MALAAALVAEIAATLSPAPDLAAFDWLEIGACCDDGIATHGGLAHDDPDVQFFTVYGHLPDMGVDALLDRPTFAAALAAAQALAAHLAITVRG